MGAHRKATPIAIAGAPFACTRNISLALQNEFISHEEEGGGGRSNQARPNKEPLRWSLPFPPDLETGTRILSSQGPLQKPQIANSVTIDAGIDDAGIERDACLP
jgi:hypothetical protein